LEELETVAKVVAEEPKIETPTDWSTFNPAKSGTPSPWAVFDAWGANDIKDGLSSELEESMLSPKAVAIPMDGDDREGLPDETDILAAYNSFYKESHRFISVICKT